MQSGVPQSPPLDRSSRISASSRRLIAEKQQFTGRHFSGPPRVPELSGTAPGQPFTPSSRTPGQGLTRGRRRESLPDRTVGDIRLLCRQHASPGEPATCRQRRLSLPPRILCRPSMRRWLCHGYGCVDCSNARGSGMVQASTRGRAWSRAASHRPAGQAPNALAGAAVAMGPTACRERPDRRKPVASAPFETWMGSLKRLPGSG